MERTRAHFPVFSICYTKYITMDIVQNICSIRNVCSSVQERLFLNFNFIFFNVTLSCVSLLNNHDNVSLLAIQGNDNGLLEHYFSHVMQHHRKSI